MSVYDLELPIYPKDIEDPFDAIEWGLAEVAMRPTTCREHLESLLSTYVKNTMFRQKDIYALHMAVIDVGGLDVPSYSKSTMRKVLKEMRDDNLITSAQKEKQAGEDLWWYVPALPNLANQQHDHDPGSAAKEGMPEISDSKTPVTLDGRVKQFFVDFFSAKLG